MTVALSTHPDHLPTPEYVEKARRVDMALAEAGYPDLCVSASANGMAVSASFSLYPHFPHAAVSKAFDLVLGPVTP